MNLQFFEDYFSTYGRLAFDKTVWPRMARAAETIRDVRSAGGKLLLFGNGASASLAEHAALDFTKQGKITAMTCHDASLITAFANDFTYDLWMAEAVKHFAGPNDATIFISVSGTSPSVVEGAKAARALDLPVLTFTGRDAQNPLLEQGTQNFHVPSDAYNLVECVHGIWLTTVVDYLIGNAVYETRMYDLQEAS